MLDFSDLVVSFFSVGFSLNSITLLPSAISKMLKSSTVRVEMVLSLSDAHRLGQPKAIVVFKYVIFPENCFVFFAVCIDVLCLSVYIFPGGRSCFPFASSVPCDFMNLRPVAMLTR